MPVPAQGPVAEYEAATVKPRRALAKAGIKLPTPSFTGCPLLWRYMPLGVVVQTLIDNGIVDKASVFSRPGIAPKGPAWWIWRRGECPPNARAALYRWLCDEWNRYGHIMTQSRIWLDRELQRPADPPVWLHALKSMMFVRDAVARYAGLEPWPEPLDPQQMFSPRNNGKAVYPELVDYVFALDQSLDRFRDTLRSIILDRLVHGDCTVDEHAEAVTLLQGECDAGLWPNVVEDLNKVCGA